MADRRVQRDKFLDTKNVERVCRSVGPRMKVVFSNILPESTRNEPKFPLKIAFMFRAIIFKWQLPNGDIFLVIRKKGDFARRSLVRGLDKQHEKYS